MPYRLIETGTYPETGLPVYRVYDAEEYADVTCTPRHIGEVWATGTRGVLGAYIPTGARWALAGSWEESPVYPAGHYAEAARAMIAAYEARGAARAERNQP